MKKIKNTVLLLITTGLAIYSCSKKNDPQPSAGGGGGGGNASTTEALVVETGSRVVQPGSSLSYTANIVDINGNITPATNVSWSINNSELGSFSGGVFTAGSGTGEGEITATVNFNGKSVTTKIPIGVQIPAAFVVLPGIYSTIVNAPSIQLTPVYIGSQNPGTYSYSSGNTNIATVDASGNVSFVGAGLTSITVTASGLDGNNTVPVPIMVFGNPSVPLLVTRVEVSPAGADIFKNETAQFTARAFKSDGSELTNPTITWRISGDSIASVNSSGLATGTQFGATYVQAIVNGVSGQSQLTVNPDKFIEITPYYVSISAGGTQQLNVAKYNVTRGTSGGFNLTQTTLPPDLTWEVVTYGLSIFDIATISSSGLVTMRQNATVGLGTLVLASSPSDPDLEPGATFISVGFAQSCNCGSNVTGHTGFTGVPSSITIPFIGFSEQLNITPVNASNQTVQATIVYCSSNDLVASVTSGGFIQATGSGSATITVCVGGISATIPVTVQ